MADTTAMIAALVLRAITSTQQVQEVEMQRFNDHSECFDASMTWRNAGMDAECRNLDKDGNVLPHRAGDLEPSYLYGYGLRQPDVVIQWQER